jgi:hypothetical protein
MNNFNVEQNEVYGNLQKLAKKTDEALDAEHVDGDQVTKLLFAQMLEGLKLQQFGNQDF